MTYLLAQSLFGPMASDLCVISVYDRNIAIGSLSIAILLLLENLKMRPLDKYHCCISFKSGHPFVIPIDFPSAFFKTVGTPLGKKEM